MSRNRDKTHGDRSRSGPALSDTDQERIRTVFAEEMVPRLQRLQARTGNLSCEFAGREYKNWTLRFVSMGSGFGIAEFEYDEEACALDLDL